MRIRVAKGKLSPTPQPRCAPVICTPLVATFPNAPNRPTAQAPNRLSVNHIIHYISFPTLARRILDCDDELEWCLFYYSGAAAPARLSYR